MGRREGQGYLPVAQVQALVDTQGVQYTAELQRVLSIPRRLWSEEDTHRLAGWLTTHLRTPGGTQVLRPVQAVALWELSQARGLFGIIRVGAGKCHGVGTPIAMYDGRVVRVEDVRPGDLVAGPDGPKEVLSTTKGHGPLFRIVPVKGDPWVCNDVHVLTVIDSVSGQVSDVPLDEFLTWSQKRQKEAKLFQPEQVGFSQKPSPTIDPYFLGVWYGDGTKLLNGVSITKPDPEIRQLCYTMADQWGLTIRERVDPRTGCPTYFMTGTQHKHNPLLNELRRVVGDLSGLAFNYVTGSLETRRAFLAGLLDSDGYKMHNCNYEITQKNEGFAKGIAFLARSLGFRVTEKIKIVNGVSYYRLTLMGDATQLPLRIPRKVSAPRQQKKNPLRTGFSVEPIGNGDYYGFELSGDGRYLLGDMTVTHNTLISLLARFMVPCQRPLLLTKAALVEKTKREMQELAQHWQVPRDLRIVSYELLGRPQSAGLLQQYRPDLIICDEAHKLRNPRAAVTRRVARYMAANPETVCVFMSGTITKRSLKDYSRLLRWALKPTLAPIPQRENELEEWADALDEKVNPLRRLDVGALLYLCGHDEDNAPDALSAARQAYYRRLVQTQAVVATAQTPLDCSLLLSAAEPELGRDVDAAVRHIRDFWETPDGWPIADAITLWRHLRELALGFFYRWNPRPPDEWLFPRKAWASECREIIKHSRRFDSEGQVVREIQLGNIQSHSYWAWKEVEKTFIPNTECVWLDDSVVQYASEWAKKAPGIIWCEHVEFARRLAERANIDYYGRGGVSERTGRPIESHPANGAMIASIASNSEGRNLQAWSRNLIISPPANGPQWEQLLARTHRDGQQADEVSFDVIMTCIEHYSALEQAQRDARYCHQTQGQLQKLLYADMVFPSEAELIVRKGPRWEP